MLKLERVSKYYFSGNNVVQALRRINLEFKIGEFVSITGESGSGKSTLLNVLSGLDTYEEGKLYFNNEDISHYTLEELEHYRKDYIGYIFQEYNIISSYTVYQNIELALTIQDYSKDQIHKRVEELIEQVGLTHVTHQKVSKISGGEKQRTVIARTLAKDYQILVCDEPTGNLNEESSIEIFKLLKEVSKDKLVIVVTHDISLLKKFATRKIRLYDGEIMEDSQLLKKTIDVSQEILPKESQTSFMGSFKIALNNIFSVPKKTLFSLLTIIFMLAMVFFVYSLGIVEVNKSSVANNPYFTNADDSRIILMKEDKTQFTDNEFLEISNIDKVKGTFNNDLVFDTILVTKVNHAQSFEGEFISFKPLSILSIDKYDLESGRLPLSNSEVVVGNLSGFSIGDIIDVANDHLLFKTSSIETNQFEFEVVGIIEEPEDTEHYFYLSNSGLEVIASSSVIEHSEISIQIEGTKTYDTPSNTWITPELDDTVETDTKIYEVSYPIWIELYEFLDDGEILTFNMMYFEICRDFNYKVEVRDDMEAGLCYATDFVDSHSFTFRTITTFENNNTFEPITILSFEQSQYDNSLKLFMNEYTYNNFFNEENYQITVIVKDAYDGNQVIEELEELGYNAFYPSQVISNSVAESIVVHNMVVILIVATLIFVVFFLSYFILKNIVFSKLKDYLIIRSIGTSKKSIKQILRLELFSLTMLSFILIIVSIIVIESYVHAIPDILRFFKWHNYLLLIGLIVGIIEFMVFRFSKKIFDASVITALKGAER